MYVAKKKQTKSFYVLRITVLSSEPVMQLTEFTLASQKQYNKQR